MIKTNCFRYFLTNIYVIIKLRGRLFVATFQRPDFTEMDLIKSSMKVTLQPNSLSKLLRFIKFLLKHNKAIQTA